MSYKSIFAFLIITFFSFGHIARAGAVITLNLAKDNVSRVTNKNYLFETGKLAIAENNETGDYLLKKYALSKNSNNEKNAQYTMSVVFQEGESRKTMTLQGNYNFANKQYDGSVIGASLDERGLIGLPISGGDKQLKITAPDFGLTGKIFIFTETVKTTPPIERLGFTVYGVMSGAKPQCDVTQWEQANETQRQKQASDFAEARRIYSLEATNSIREFANRMGWEVRYQSNMEPFIQVFLPLYQLYLLEQRTDVSSIREMMAIPANAGQLGPCNEWMPFFPAL